MEEAFMLLKKYKNKLNKQQFKTFKGQILSGNIDGFKKGLTKLLQKEI